jgi:Tfp pilus assembly protein PilV
MTEIKKMAETTNQNLQNGQTLIETVVGIFMLTMGISAALGLAIYAFGSSTSINKQIIATGLAREGIEAVKDMRDTNWLKQTAYDTNCYDFVSNTQTANCYKNWLGDATNSVTPYCLNPSGSSCGGGDVSDNYFLTIDETSKLPGFWALNKDSSGNFGLLYDRLNAGNKGLYFAPAGGVACANNASSGGYTISDYCR